MGRRTALLIVAALVAALGSGMVLLYVHGADSRAEAEQAPVQVLKAVAQIDMGETMADAQAKGKLQLGSVPRKQVLPGAVDSTAGLTTQQALSTIYPNEQIIRARFGAKAAVDDGGLQIPAGNIAISVNLSDTGRVAGFVTPGSDVAVFTSSASDKEGGTGTRLLLAKVPVIAVGATTTVAQTTTTAAGAQTTEQLPKTLFTLSLDQLDAERVIYANAHGDLTFGLLNAKSKVATGPGVTSANLFN